MARDKEAIRSAVSLSQVIAQMTGQQTRRRGRELVVCCPFHDDSNPSLRIDDEKGGGVWRCDPCSKGGDMFDFVMEHEGVSFPEAVDVVAEHCGVESVAHTGLRTSMVAAAYDYCDAKGDLLYQVCRVTTVDGKKKFSQRRPDGNGGWIWNLNGVERVLYRLPALLRADPSVPVYNPEGEKDVDSVVALGLVATCNSGGAGEGKWKPSFSELLRNRVVIVLPDNDEIGREHAERVARSLTEVQGTTVKVVELPGLPHKGDVSDWLQSGGTREALEAIVKQTPVWSPPQSDSVSQTGLSTTPDVLDRAAALEFMNERLAVVRESGKTVVINEEQDVSMGRTVVTRSSFQDIRNFYGAQKVEDGAGSGGERKLVSLGSWWLGQTSRRQYEGITCAPGMDVPGVYYNLWRGFALEPRSGDWSLYRQHIYEIICGEKPELFDWVMAFLAHGVQQPGAAPEVALVLRGGRGIGKGAFIRPYGSLFGQHFVHVAQARHLVGHFNAHLRDAVVVFADEAFFPGDKQAEGALKMLITEPTIPIEQKGRDVVVVKNIVHLLIASNQDWVVPAGLDERRFCVLDVSDARQQDHDYFQAIAEQMEAGGLAALLYDLQHHDSSGVNLRQVPTTPALIEQKMLSMEPAQRWWFQKLMDGQLLPDHEGWTSQVLKMALHHDYVQTLGKIGVPRKSTETELGLLLKKLLPSAGLDKFRRLAAVPFHLGHADEGLAKNLWHWGFPPLKECRADFDRVSRSAHEWPVEAAEDDG